MRADALTGEVVGIGVVRVGVGEQGDRSVIFRFIRCSSARSSVLRPSVSHASNAAAWMLESSHHGPLTQVHGGGRRGGDSSHQPTLLYHSGECDNRVNISTSHARAAS